MATQGAAQSNPKVPKELTPVVDQIVDQFHPQQVILFGSHARQTAHAFSDIDLLVVMETQKKNTNQAIDIVRALDYRGGLDLIVRTPKTLQERIALGDSFLQDIVKEGIVLYARSNN